MTESAQWADIVKILKKVVKLIYGVYSYGVCLSGLKFVCNGLIQVKEEGWTGFPKEQTCQPEENPRPSQLFYLDLHFIFKKFLVIFLNFSNIYL